MPISCPRAARGAILLGVALAASSSSAATLTWPNLNPVGACRGTLQACLDGAAPGDIVQIGADDLLFPDRYTVIDESVLLDKSLTLRAAEGIDAVFRPGRGVTISPPPVPLLAYDVALEGVTLARGTVTIRDRALAPSTYRVERVRIHDVPEDQCAIDAYAPFGAVPDFQILRNVIRVAADRGTRTHAVCTASEGLDWRATVFGNRIESPNGGFSGAILAASTATGPVNLGNNVILGRGFAHGIEVVQPGGSGRMRLQVAGNSVSGQDALPAQASGGIAVYANDAELQIVNNTVVDGYKGLMVTPFGAVATTSGLIANNLVAHHRSEGLVISTALSGVANRNNLVFDNASDVFVPGPGTRNQAPQLESLAYPRPRDTSPAINAGSNAALPALQLHDVDGLPRVLLATVDIGAYEAGHAITGVHESRPDNLVANRTDLGLIGIAAPAPGAIVVASPLYTPTAGAALRQHLGIAAPAGAGNPPLSLLHENDAVPMPPGRRFAVTVPGFGLSGFVHVSSSVDVTAQYTTLSHARLDGDPDAIAVAMHDRRDGVAHDHAIGLEYFGARWHLRNEDAAVDMPSGRRFDVVIAPALSENAFRRVAPNAPVVDLPLAHPLLDDNACAAPIVGRVDPIGSPMQPNPVAFSLEYRAGIADAPGRWFVRAEGETGRAFPPLAGFNVILDGAQANRCRSLSTAPLLRDGFESAP